MEIHTGSHRRWIAVASAALTFIALGGVGSVMGSGLAVAEPTHRPVPSTQLAPRISANTQPTSVGSTDSAPKACQVTLRSTPFTATYGFSPSSRLTPSGDNFYGVTGGAYDNEDDEQVLPGGTFRLTDEGKLTTLDEFPQVDQGGNFTTIPNAGLVQADDGNFYGTIHREAAGPVGTVFRMTPKGTVTTIYTFATGGFPADSLVEGPDASMA
jgi:hypothetical protein